VVNVEAEVITVVVVIGEEETEVEVISNEEIVEVEEEIVVEVDVVVEVEQAIRLA